jgi:hypothetical protein
MKQESKEKYQYCKCLTLTAFLFLGLGFYVGVINENCEPWFLIWSLLYNQKKNCWYNERWLQNYIYVFLLFDCNEILLILYWYKTKMNWNFCSNWLVNKKLIQKTDENYFVYLIKYCSKKKKILIKFLMINIFYYNIICHHHN